MREVKVAVMEVDGEVSVLKQDWAEPVRRVDVSGSKNAGNESSEVPPEKRTDTPKALGYER
jgi:uncharacterized membrane protein YcaP (DUF421 family)